MYERMILRSTLASIPSETTEARFSNRTTRTVQICLSSSYLDFFKFA